MVEIDGYSSTFSWDYGSVWGSYGILGLEPNMCYTLCVQLSDNSGNEEYECRTFYTEPEPTDTCPPRFIWHSPAEGETLTYDGGLWWSTSMDSAFAIDFEEFGCPGTGIDTSSLHIWLAHCDDSVMVEIDGYSSTFSWDYGSVWGSYGILGLEPNMCYTLCAQLSDNSGNEEYECRTFYTGEIADTTDLCPPYVTEWYPPDMSTLCPPDEDIWFRIIDPAGDASFDCPVCTGIDRSSLEVHLYNDGSVYPMFDGGGLTLEPLSECGLDVALDNAYYMLTPGTGATLCVSGADLAGNDFDSCIVFEVCDTGIVDDCIPEIVEWSPPLDSCLHVEGPWGVRIDDPYDSTCPGVSGIDRSTFLALMIVESDTYDVTTECWINSWGFHGIEVEWLPDGWRLPGDIDITVCITVSDNDSNTASECQTFHTCLPETVDACAPSVVEWHPDMADTLCPPSSDIWFRVIDPAGTDECPICSGIDRSSLEVHLYDNGSVYPMFDGVGLFIEGFGDCGVDIGLYDAYYTLSPGTGATLCVSGADIAGNDFSDCITFFICDTTAPSDTCPPEVDWSSPAAGETLVYAYGLWLSEHATYMDSTFSLNFEEFGCPGTGIDTSSLHIWLGNCDDSGMVEIDGYGSYFSWDYGTAYGSLGLLDLEPNMCYTLCAQVADNAGNEGYDCITFYTGEIPDTIDYCPPTVTSWFPEADTCIATSSPLGLVLTDPLGDTCPVASGVDLLSTVVTVEIGADSAIDITSECDFTTEGDYIGISWNHIGMALPDGEDIVLCVSASDFDSNSMHDCFTWHTCGGAVEDLCPPVAGIEYPDTTHCIPADSGMVMIDVWDQLNGDCPVRSGVDSSSIQVFLYADDDSASDITSDCYIYSLGSEEGYRIYWIYSDLEVGSNIMLCVHASDLAGNIMDPPVCYTWTVCDTTEEDLCPPTVDWISIYDGSDGVPVDEFVGFDLFDPHGTEECPICTGIDTTSVMMTLITETDTMEYPLTEMNWTAGECMLSAWLDSTFRLEYGTEYTLCIDASDNAGNMMETYCVHFTTEAESLTDTWPPCISSLYPLPGDEITPPVEVWANICDNCDGADVISSVDSTTIVMTVDGEDITDELGFEPIDCFGWSVLWDTDYLSEGEHEVCLWAYDYAGNAVDTCWSFTVNIPDTVVNVEILEPFDGTFSACDDQQIVALFVDGIASVPDSFTLRINGETYTLTSSEISLSADTLVFTPPISWEDGDTVCYHIGTAYGCFVIDLSGPAIELNYPACDDTLLDTPTYISIHFGDELSGLDESSIVVTINAAVFTADSPGVYWDTGVEALIINPDVAGITLEGEVEVCGMATDSPDYCTPNSSVSCCSFYLLPPHPYYIAGHVMDTILSTPLEGFIVAGFHIFGLPFAEHTVTDADGFYCIEVGHGAWIAAALDPSFTYPPMFWDGHPYPFDADPIFIPPTSGDTVWANFNYGSAPASFFRVSGSVQDETSTPIQGVVLVAIATDDENEELGISSGITDSLGAFSIPVAPGKNYYIRAFAKGYKQSSHTGRWNWDVSDSMIVTGDITGLDFTLTPEPTDSGTSSIYGTVYREFTGLDEEEMRGVLVCLCDISTEEPEYCDFSNYEGNYEIDNVSDGTYRLMADRPLYTIQGEWETVVLPDTNAHDIYLQRYVGIGEQVKSPDQMVLRGAKPNPFNTSTSIEFYIPEQGHAKLEIVDIAGHTVTTLLDDDVNSGSYVSVWSAKDVPSGVYLVKLNWNGFTASQKLLLTK